MATEPTARELVARLREQARQLNATADGIERALSTIEVSFNVGAIHPITVPLSTLENSNDMLLVRLRDHTKRRSMRASELAKELGTDETRVRGLLVAENGFEKSGYGWWRYTGNGSSGRAK